MILHGTVTSPFVRKCRIVALENGIDLTLERHSVLDGVAALPNPVQRIPSLQLDDGRLLVDSRLISDYLASFPERSLEDRNLEVLCDGLMDRCVARTLRLREDEIFHNPLQLAHWVKAIETTLDYLEPPQGDFTIGAISLVCALAYLDLRHGDLNWRLNRTALADWFADISQRPSVAETDAKT